MATSTIKQRYAKKTDVIIGSSDDCNNCNNPNVIYYWGYSQGQPANRPASLSAGELLYIETAYAKLQVARYYNDTQAIYVRTLYSGTWKAWVKFTGEQI